MNINLLLNSQNTIYLNILNEFDNFNYASKNTNKSIKKSMENLNFDSIIYFFSFHEDIIQNKFFPLNNELDLKNYYNYIIILEYLNIYVNSKVIFYYDGKY